MTSIAPGAYVRVTRGMYAGATGRVVSVAVSGDGPWATLDVAEAQRVGVYLSALELVGAVPTVEQERDAAIAERDRLAHGVTAERDRLKARHAELMRLADRAFRRRKDSHEGSSLIAMARELEPTIAALTCLVGDGCGVEVSDE